MGRRLRRARALTRSLLLAGVLVGLFGMLVLGGESGNGNHLMAGIPMARPAVQPATVLTAALHTAAVHTAAVDTAAVNTAAVKAPAVIPAAAGGGAAVAEAAAPRWPHGSDQGMAACVLFLVLSGASLLTRYRRGFWRRRLTAHIGRGTGPLGDLHRRGPPGRAARPVIALCVLRI